MAQALGEAEQARRMDRWASLDDPGARARAAAGLPRETVRRVDDLRTTHQILAIQRVRATARSPALPALQQKRLWLLPAITHIQCSAGGGRRAMHWCADGPEGCSVIQTLCEWSSCGYLQAWVSLGLQPSTCQACLS